MSGGLIALSSLYYCLSVFFFGIFAYSAMELAAYTPLYRPVACRQQDTGLREPAVDSAWINITGTVEHECRNPNPYAIQISQRSLGQVFVKNGTELKLVGTSSMLNAEIQGRGRGTGKSVMEVALPVAEAIGLPSMPVLQVVSVTRWRWRARSRFFGVTVTASGDKEEVCGFELRPATQKVGPSRCAETVEELVVPDVDAERLEVSAWHLRSDGLAPEALKKNALFGCALAVSFLGAVASVALAWRARARNKAVGSARAAPRAGGRAAAQRQGGPLGEVV